ncbi:MAG: ComEC family competence protein [candidate division Zixibacteria bacterium]|nr:ComEC family competence protein [candidate division Zixibacteria bacterium]
MLAAVAVACGIVVADHFALPPWFVAALTMAAMAVAMLSLTTGRLRIICIVSITIALAALGAWRIAVENAGRPSAGLLNLAQTESRVEVFGRLAGVPVRKASGWRAPVDIVSVRAQSNAHPLRARVQLDSHQSLEGFRRGDYMRATGWIEPPLVRRNPGGFDYSDYLFRQGIDAVFRPTDSITLLPQPGVGWSLPNLAENVRQWIRSALAAHLPTRSLALMLGFLVGDTDRMPDDIYTAFRESGTLHLLAVSGANVWLFVGMLYWPLRLLSVPRWPRTLILLCAVLFFSFLTRNEPSVVRAGLMVGMILLGRLLWRPVHPLDAVGAAGVIILLISPAHLFRAGFQLSFAAVLAIIVAVRYAQRSGIWRRRPWRRRLGMVVLPSIAATVATIPVTAWNFGTVPLAGVLANLVMVPLAGVVAHLGIVMLAAHAVSPVIAGWLSWPTDFVCGAAIRSAHFFSTLPGAVIPWSNPSWVAIVHFYGAAALILFWRRRHVWLRPVAYYAVAASLVLVAWNLLAVERPVASVALLDTGRQRAIAVATSSGSPVWIADDPGIDQDLMQWVVEPFSRSAWGVDPPDHWLSWRRADSAAGLSVGRGGSIRWRRYIDSVGGSTPLRRIWGDRLATAIDTLILIRDLSANVSGPLLERMAADLGAGHTVVAPIDASTAQLRVVIDRLHPTRFIFHGNPHRRQKADQWLDFWRLRYPNVSFYSTPVHGGIILDFHPDGIRACPTLADGG